LTREIVLAYLDVAQQHFAVEQHRALTLLYFDVRRTGPEINESAGGEYLRVYAPQQLSVFFEFRVGFNAGDLREVGMQFP
jgi:hypothetical protein